MNARASGRRRPGARRCIRRRRRGSGASVEAPTPGRTHGAPSARATPVFTCVDRSPDAPDAAVFRTSGQCSVRFRGPATIKSATTAGFVIDAMKSQLACLVLLPGERFFILPASISHHEPFTILGSSKRPTEKKRNRTPFQWKQKRASPRFHWNSLLSLSIIRRCSLFVRSERRAHANEVPLPARGLSSFENRPGTQCRGRRVSIPGHLLTILRPLWRARGRCTESYIEAHRVTRPPPDGQSAPLNHSPAPPRDGDQFVNYQCARRAPV